MVAKIKKLAELSEMVGGELTGAPDLEVRGLADLASAGPGQLSFLVKAAGLDKLKSSKASAFIVPQSFQYDEKPLIRVENPYLAAARIQTFFQAEPFKAAGISPKAHIGKDCDIPTEISIGPFACIGDRVKLGMGVTIHPGVVIGDDVTIGDSCIIYPNVTVYPTCTIGARVLIHSGTVIGSDGFGFATDTNGDHVKWPHTGTVQIDDDVEIGAGVTIDRGTFGKTLIMKGVRLDNLIQIGHNVTIGENSVLVAQVGIAGSASLGRNVVLGGQAGVKGHIHLGDHSMVGGKSGVTSNLPDGSVVSGYPVIPHKDWLKASIIFNKLPQISDEMKEMKKAMDSIKKKFFPEEEQE